MWRLPLYVWILGGAVVSATISGNGTGTALAAMSVVDFNFGPHAVDQCYNSIGVISNFMGPLTGYQNQIFERLEDGSCPSEVGYCLGDCITVVVKETNDRQSRGINIIVGSDLPNPGTCVPEIHQPSPNHKYSGMCGSGESGHGYWHNCFIHDVCIWARCTDEDLKTGGFGSDGGLRDEFCGLAFEHAINDFVNARLPCLVDAQCPTGTDCKVGWCSQVGLPEGSTCFADADCEGYCKLLRCYDGSENDRCDHDHECLGDLSCVGLNPNRRCKPPKGEGGSCNSDADCKGYCQFLRCWDGSRGDKCGSTADCQAGLSCKRRCAICAQKTCQ